MTFHEITAADGRVLEVLAGGDPDGFPWLFHNGSPSAAVPYPAFDDAARRAGLRMITYSRPGYGASSPWPDGHRPRFVDDVADSVRILDELGAGDFVTLGWSGGGPRALACAALLPDRCQAALTLAGVAPHHGEGLDWFAGMAPENVAEYTAALAGAEAYGAYLEAEFLPVMAATPDQIAEAMGELVTDVDRAALSPELAAWLSASFTRAGAQGVVGVRDDGLAGVSGWGFDLASITTPVSVWQGAQDAMVPLAHGAWLAVHVPDARAHLEPDEGHLSLGLRIDELLAELKELAGLSLDPR